MGEKKKIEIIQALRGIAALGVVYYHTEYGPWKSANWGVDFFFILSGYFLMDSTERTGGGYWKNKLIKLLPLYYVMTVIVVIGFFAVPSAFRSTTVNVQTLIKSICFIPFVNENGEAFPIYAVGWTLNLEVFYYVIFYVSMKISHRLRGQMAMGITCFIFLLGVVFKPDSTVLRFWSRPELIDFVIGIGIYNFEKCTVKRTKLKNDVSYLGIIGIIILLFSGKYILGENLKPLWDPWDVLWSSVLLCYGLQLRTVSINRYSHLKLLGDMSYSIYMTHFVIVRMICRDLSTECHSIINLVIVLSAIALSIGCSWVTYQVFEVRISRALKARFK